MLVQHSAESARHNLKIVSQLLPLKDELGLRTPGIYSIPCECGRVYIGQSGRSVQLRIKEHNRHIRLSQPVNHGCINHDHIINPLKLELNLICHLLALLGAHHFLHVSRIRVKLLTFRLLMSYIYIWSTHS